MVLSRSGGDESLLPLYDRIRRVLEERIRSGLYPPGSKLPSEERLAEEFSVTRVTLRQALGELKERGFVDSRRGLGTFVTVPPIEQRLDEFYSFGPTFRKANSTLTVRLLWSGWIEDPTGIGLGRVLSIFRLRSYGDRPFGVERAYVPRRVAPELDSFDLGSDSLYHILESEYDVHISRAEEYLEPAILSEPEASYLDLSVGTAVFSTERRTFDVTGSIVEARTTVVRPDMVRYRAELKY
ncbi:MAG: GntR family transcriptional regulator [Alkalispirochaetaceae bacterium]